MSNDTYGVDQIRDANLTGVEDNYNGTSFQEFENQFSDLFLEGMAGSYEVSGTMLLILVGFGLYQSEASTDVTLTVMIPLVLLLSSQGFLPYSQAITFGSLIIITGLAIFGLFKFAGR